MCSVLPQSISTGCDADERRRKRMQCNRESARRSRMKKQQKFDYLNAENQRLVDENRKLVEMINRNLIDENEKLVDENKKLKEMIDGVSQLYVNLASENNAVRAEKAELTYRLESLNSVLQNPYQVSSLDNSVLELWQPSCPVLQPIPASAHMFQC